MHIRNILVFIFIFFINLSAKSETSTVDCNQIFEERREELLNTINKIEEAKQSFKEFKDSANSLLNDREVSIDKKDKDVQALLSEIENRKENIKKMLGENKNMLGDIKKEKDDKITMTFAKMKASKAAPILEAMDVSKSSEIIFALDPKSMGKLLSKIEPSKASTIVNLIQKGPPFKEKEFFEYEKKQIENKISNRFKDYGDEDNIRKPPINRDKKEELEQPQVANTDEKQAPAQDTTGIVDIAQVVNVGTFSEPEVEEEDVPEEEDGEENGNSGNGKDCCGDSDFVDYVMEYAATRIAEQLSNKFNAESVRYGCLLPPNRCFNNTNECCVYNRHKKRYKICMWIEYEERTQKTHYLEGRLEFDDDGARGQFFKMAGNRENEKLKSSANLKREKFPVIPLTSIEMPDGCLN